MEKAFLRTQLLIGEENINILKNAHVAVFGIGGVGGFAIEALARSGVGKLTIFDSDVIEESNLNRQIISTEETVGMDKVEVAKKRLLSINSEMQVFTEKLFYLPENAHLVDLEKFDYVIDAIDTVTAKLHLIKRAKEKGVKIISCMGTGGKLDITKLKVADVYKTQGCPLARVMRHELKKIGVENLKVVYSEEKALTCETGAESEKRVNGRACPPSMIFVPATAGLMLAKEVVFDLIKGSVPISD